jgi:hypothetical protein
VQWHDRYFDGRRKFPENSTCGPVEIVDVRGYKIAILPVNSALFCQDGEDHAKLWIGRRCLDPAIEKMKDLDAALKIALVHHPLEWLHDEERSNVKTAMQSACDLVLRGHLHETDIESVAGTMGNALHMAAGAAYQTRKWPNRALYQSFQDGRIEVFPIRYEDQPRELWTVDPNVFPSESNSNYTKGFAVHRLTKPLSTPATPLQERKSERPASLPRFRSTIPSRRHLPFAGREKLLEEIRIALGNPSSDAVVVLHGQSGASKSEVAREFARRQRDAYPGGTFIVDAGKQAIVVDLARLGQTVLGLDVPPGMALEDQCVRTLTALAAAPSLLIYDNVQAEDAVGPWLPPSGMPCHVLMTTTLDIWGPEWRAFEVPPLSTVESIELISQIGGREVSEKYGARLATLGRRATGANRARVGDAGL